MYKNQSSIDGTKVCPKCSYDRVLKGEIKCPICHTKLVDKKTLKSSQSVNQIVNKSSSEKKRGSSKANQAKLVFKNKTKNWLNFVRQNSISNSTLSKQLNEVKKPVNLLGLGLLTFSITLWIGYFFAQTKVEVIEIPEQKIEVAKAPISEVPEGLFNYGGDSIFAPLVASGINSAMELAFPQFELRYAKPLNQDFSSLNGIKMLLDGELSFAYNARALNTEQYQNANLRSIELKSVPIAIDGVVMYSNISILKSKLNRKQIGKIYSGEITNWNQINPLAEDLPIVPVIVKDENLQLVGLSKRSQLPKSTQYTDNYTLALRKVIATPGAISFASASLVQNQRLVKTFDLADGGSINYIEPTVENFKNATYPLTRRIYLVYRQDGTIDQKAAQAYIDFISSPVGQKIVKEAKLVPIH